MSVQELPAGILLSRLRMGKLRHPGAGCDATSSGLQGSESTQISHSLSRLTVLHMATPCPGVLPTACLSSSSSLQVLKDSVRYKNELSDMSRMWVSG